MIALHARKSAAAIAAFPGPVVVAATGTDLYQDWPHDPDARASFTRAWRIVTLHPTAGEVLPAELRDRVRPILQSAAPLEPLPPQDPPTTVVVVGHLRAVKDPLVVGRALAHVPSGSSLRVVQVGGALEPELGRQAEALAARDPRYRWVGALPPEQALRALASAHLLAVPSLVEGGANVIGEAVVHGVPVVASRAHGNVGLLGADWPALFDVGDAQGLAALLVAWESRPEVRREWADRTRALAPRFALSAELAAWRALLSELDRPTVPHPG